MAKSGRRKARDLYSIPNVLRTESEAEYKQLLADISRDIEPQDAIERIFVGDVVFHTWEVMRYRRIKNSLLGNSFHLAVGTLMQEILLPPSPNGLHQKSLASQDIAYEWRHDFEDANRRVLKMLKDVMADESAIEAKTFRIVADDLERADRMLRAAETDRDRALRSIAKYRKSFAQQLRSISDRVLAADDNSRISENTIN
jgi:hypothetical protein